MSVQTRNTASSAPAVPAPFAGLGHAMEAALAAALSCRPRLEPAAAERPPFQPAGPHGYALLCRLCRETRAG